MQSLIFESVYCIHEIEIEIASIGLEPNVFKKHYDRPIKMAPSKKAKKNFGRTSQLISKKMNIHPLFTLPIRTHTI
jgi:hypothetical protein